MATASSDTRVQWMWNSSENPFSKNDATEWSPYADIQNIIIEEAYQAKESYASLDDYYVDFKYKLQKSKKNENNQRPVKRMVRNRNDTHVREERFTYTRISPKQPFAGLYGWISPFIRATAKYLNITKEQLPSRDSKTVAKIVEAAAHGIRQEGINVGKPIEAEKLAKILMEKRNASMKEVWQCCAKLYSMESFLYKKLNETMRLIGSEGHEQIWRSKVSTLGPFCLLLWDNPFNDKTTEKGKTLYRGAELCEQEIASFKNDCGKEKRPSRSFQSFTSCTRNQQVAEGFGNVLFVMEVKHAFTVDIQPYSYYNHEEEELLSPGVCFTVDRVEFDQSKNKHVIYLKLVQQYRQDDRQQIFDNDDAGRDAGGGLAARARFRLGRDDRDAALRLGRDDRDAALDGGGGLAGFRRGGGDDDW